MQRATLGGAARFEGVGLFTGAKTRVAVLPSDEGLTIARVDQEASARVALRIEHLVAEAGARNTSIVVRPGATVATIEHLMSALAGLGVTDAHVEVDGPEIPAGDGSSAFIVDAIMNAGIIALDAAVDEIVPAEPLRVQGRDGASIEVSPAPHPSYTYSLAYRGKSHIIGDQSATWDGGTASYVSDIAPARTFCLEEEAVAMRAAGLFEHLTPRDMLVLSERGPIDNAYRFANEPARHKVLDLIGDLALAGRPIRARVVATRAGHALNHEMARLLATL